MAEGDSAGTLGVDVLRLGGTTTAAGGVVFGVGVGTVTIGEVPLVVAAGVAAPFPQPAPTSEAAITK